MSQGISDLFRHGSRRIEGLESLLEELGLGIRQAGTQLVIGQANCD